MGGIPRCRAGSSFREAVFLTRPGDQRLSWRREIILPAWM